MRTMAQRRIGDVLVSRRVVSGAMVTAALGEAKRKGEKLCSVLLRHGVEEGRLAGALAELFGTPGVDLSRSVIPLDVLELVPAEVARADLVLPLSREGGRLHLAVASPETATAQVDEVRVSSGLEVSVYVAVHAALKDVIEQAYTAATRGHLVWRGKGATASGPWVGIGSGGNVFGASTSWHEALRALRFASSTGYGRRAVAYERLSSLELLADLPMDRVRRNRDVARINEIASSPTGALEVQTMEAFFVFGSLRRTAAELHVHHSTVAARLAHVQAQMGWDLDDPMDRFLATLVLMVRRIALSSAELADADLL